MAKPKLKEFRLLLRDDEGGETTLVGDFASYDDIVEYALQAFPDFSIVEEEAKEEVEAEAEEGEEKDS